MKITIPVMIEATCNYESEGFTASVSVDIDRSSKKIFNYLSTAEQDRVIEALQYSVRGQELGEYSMYEYADLELDVEIFEEDGYFIARNSEGVEIELTDTMIDKVDEKIQKRSLEVVQ